MTGKCQQTPWSGLYLVMKSWSMKEGTGIDILLQKKVSWSNQGRAGKKDKKVVMRCHGRPSSPKHWVEETGDRRTGSVSE